MKAWHQCRNKYIERPEERIWKQTEVYNGDGIKIEGERREYVLDDVGKTVLLYIEK